MSLLLALLAGAAGCGLGFLAGAAAASVLAPLLGITGFEGASGYFAVFIGGPIGAILGFVAGAVLVLRRRSPTGRGAIAGRLALVAAGFVGLAAAGLGAMWFMRPVIETNGPAPQLAFEIRLPPGTDPPGAKGYAIELQTSRNRMPGRLEPPRRQDGRAVIVGNVEIYYRTWQRTLVLTTPDRTDVLFEIRLGLSPASSAAFGAWQPASYVAEPGKDTARPARPSDGYEIRYRTVRTGEE
ncbi:hypothetical protein [Reyranella sp.]|uniref:hypothetical protein n=1 Tax=Reyranella sp. TaxID=1929291 RepID=UPI003BAACCF9